MQNKNEYRGCNETEVSLQPIFLGKTLPKLLYHDTILFVRNNYVSNEVWPRGVAV